MGKVILIASGKGGVGKTVFTSNIGAKLALQGYKVVLIDMNMGLRNLDICLGLENKIVYDVADVLSGICRIKQALVRDRRFPELYLMSAAQNKQKAEITPLHMKVLCKKLKNSFDYIIIDAPAGVDENLEIAGAGADMAVIITVPEYAAVRDADALDHLLMDMSIEKRTYVINKVKANLISSGLVPSIAQIAETMRPDMAGIIQYDENIHIAANNGMPIVYKEGTYIEKNFTKIIDRIIGLI
ncbi:MAG: septum site-determining protein MinD [Eubacteriales bacterium]|nr:septum site-determining protein MinD [Eubacteriales bacterium]MDD3199489.1 septum site-determining protein MinD [Eubacteriales bacterium]MDD4629736.1 septum site-determining protein MinD [Eubacteriales bacterium]